MCRQRASRAFHVSGLLCNVVVHARAGLGFHCIVPLPEVLCCAEWLCMLADDC